MKSSLWTVIAIVCGIVGFLMGYSTSAYTGIQKIEAAAKEKQVVPAPTNPPAPEVARPAPTGYPSAPAAPKPAPGGYGAAPAPAPTVGGYGAPAPANTAKTTALKN